MPFAPHPTPLTPEMLVTQLKGLPSSGKILPTLQTLVESDDVMLDRIAEVIQLEPGLATNVVRMSNSSLFGGGSQVSSITEAIQRVGLKGVQELVASAVGSQLTSQALKTYQLSSEQQWMRAVTCALAASSLAERKGSDQMEAYTAGLLHGIGLVALDHFAVQSKLTGGLESSGYPYDFAPAERVWLGFSHAEVGAALLKNWGFSEAVTTAVQFQLQPELGGEHRSLCMLLATARWARTLFCVPEEVLPELPLQQWLDETGIQVSDFNPWLNRLRERCSEAVDGLRLRR